MMDFESDSIKNSLWVWIRGTPTIGDVFVDWKLQIKFKAGQSSLESWLFQQ